MNDYVKVYTVAICGRCGKQNQSPGAEASYPPAEWSEVSMTKRLAGVGWTNNEHTVPLMPLCPSCAEVCARVIKGEKP